MKDKRYRFKTDDDGHWYIIPANLEEKFCKLCYDTDDDYIAFNDKFGHMMIGCHPSCYTFTDPVEDI